VNEKTDVREERVREAFEANARPLRSYLRKLSHGSHEAAEDLLQETMLRAWRRVDDLPGSEESMRRWLFTVARNLAIDAARARQTRPVEVCGEDVTWVGVADDALDPVLERERLREALLRLTAEQRAVLVSLYYGDLSVAQTAARLGIPPGTVRSRAFYALRSLRQLLDQPGRARTRDARMAAVAAAAAEGDNHARPFATAYTASVRSLAA
jgi:RNA polymerase sigma-70 factor, ECF subfamily